MLRRQQAEHEQLRSLQQREIEKSKQVREPLIYRHEVEKNRIEDWHNRELHELNKRYPDQR